MPIEHALQYVGQIGIGLDIVELGSLCRPSNYAECLFDHGGWSALLP
ncbi:hypothetical protein HNQ95_005714, partial [Aminobacter ciceronei]|nr:hypothetical protein [Aminobacter ciceronei]MBA9023680.1 hypothetical protein [Aminobacter ciceronei]